MPIYSYTENKPEAYTNPGAYQGLVTAPDPNTAINTAVNRYPTSGVALASPSPYAPTAASTPITNPLDPNANRRYTPTAGANIDYDKINAAYTYRRGGGGLSLSEERGDTPISGDRQRQMADEYAAGQRQARIDAINMTFAPRLARQKEEGERQLSRVAALNFNQGTIGTGADTTKTGAQKDVNEQNMRRIEDEQAMLINQAFNEADQLGQQRLEYMNSQGQYNEQQRAAKQKELTDRAMQTIQLFGKTGKSYDEIMAADPQTIQTLKDVGGYSDAAIATMLAASAPEGTYQWGQVQYVGNKMIVPKVVNGKVTLESIDAPEGVDMSQGDWKFSPSLGTGGGWYNEKTKQVEFIGSGGNGTDVGGDGVNIPTFEEFRSSLRSGLDNPYKGVGAVVDLPGNEASIKKLYNEQFGPSATNLTKTQKQKLDQAGLLNAPKQKQLDFLYGKKDTKKDTAAGIVNLYGYEEGTKEYKDTYNLIKQYQDAGYTDVMILKMLKGEE